MNKNQRIILSWVLIAIYAIVTIIRKILAPDLLSVPVSTALITFVPLLFVFVHGSLSYRLRDLLIFAAVTLVVSNIFENMSVLTGFPFGNYVYTENIGPKLFHVPLLIGPAYVGTAYLAWTIARLIAAANDSRLIGHLNFTVPLLAALMMVAWDLTMDPTFSSVSRTWVWQEGGSYFGVPFSNFLGWLLTTYVFLQMFALYLKGCSKAQSVENQPSRLSNLPAVLFYGLIGAYYVVTAITTNTSETVTDPAGMVWRIQDIYEVAGLIALFTMGTFTVLGLVKLMKVSPVVQDASSDDVPVFPSSHKPERQINASQS